MKRTSSTRLATCLSAAALAIAGLTLAHDCAFAQQGEQITVVPPFSGVRQIHRTPHRIHITQSVGHSDLDLRTDFGVQALGARISYAAAENCKLLDRYYPDSMPLAAKATRKQTCLMDAVYSTRPQVDAAIFTASR
jgi:UrcA family protein